MIKKVHVLQLSLSIWTLDVPLVACIITRFFPLHFPSVDENDLFYFASVSFGCNLWLHVALYHLLNCLLQRSISPHSGGQNQDINTGVKVKPRFPSSWGGRRGEAMRAAVKISTTRREVDARTALLGELLLSFSVGGRLAWPNTTYHPLPQATLMITDTYVIS